MVNPFERMNIGIIGLVDIIEDLLKSDSRELKEFENLGLGLYFAPEDLFDNIKRVSYTTKDYKERVDSYISLVNGVYGDKRYNRKYESPYKKILLDYNRAHDFWFTDELFLTEWHTVRKGRFVQAFNYLSYLLNSVEDACEMYRKGMIIQIIGDNKRVFSTDEPRIIKPSKEECFLVTACAESRGLPKNCEELELIRWYRNNIVRNLPNGEKILNSYYDFAPELVKSLKQRSDSKRIFDSIYEEVNDYVELIKRENSKNILLRSSEILHEYIGASNEVSELASSQLFLNEIDKLSKKF